MDYVPISSMDKSFTSLVKLGTTLNALGTYSFEDNEYLKENREKVKNGEICSNNINWNKDNVICLATFPGVYEGTPCFGDSGAPVAILKGKKIIGRVKKL